MRITDLLNQNGIELGVKADSKEAAIDRLVNLMEKAGNISDKAAYKQDILAREEMGTTGISDGIAIPHAKSAAVIRPGLSAMTVPAGVDYDSMAVSYTHLEAGGSPRIP